MTQCENCGKVQENKNIIVSVRNGCDITFLCRQCADMLGHCPTCQNAKTCGFYEDPDPMPQTILMTKTQQTPMGVMTMQRETINPERIKKFCMDCPCRHETEGDIFCCRVPQIMTCANYLEKDFYNQAISAENKTKDI